MDAERGEDLRADAIAAQGRGRLCVLAPARLRQGVREMEDTADSGLETLTRRRLRHHGFSVVAQAQIGTARGSIREDLVALDCVALEIDGRQWHGAEKLGSDYDRDLMVEGLGRRTLRLSYRSVMFDWQPTLSSAAELMTAPRGMDPRLDMNTRRTTSQRRERYHERMDAKADARAEFEVQRLAAVERGEVEGDA